MSDTILVIALAGWGLAPGLAILAAAGVRWRLVERLAAAGGLSLAVVSCSAYAAEFAGLAVAPFQIAGVVAALCAVVWAARRVLDGGAGVEPPAEAAALTPITPGWAEWIVLALPVIVIIQLAPMYEGTILPPSLHDGLDHANWFRLIYETRSINPFEVMAPPLTSSGGPTFYPWGAHAWLALVAHSTPADPVSVLMRGLVAISAWIPLSVFAFVTHLTGRRWVAVAAAAFTLVFWWLPYNVWGWGGYALLAGAVAAAPLTRLALAAVDSGRRGALAAAGLCGIGVLLVHPSQAWLALVAAAIVNVTLAAGHSTEARNVALAAGHSAEVRNAPLAAGRSTEVRNAPLAAGHSGKWKRAAPFVAAIAVFAVAVNVASVYWDPIAQFMNRAASVGGRLAGDPLYRWPTGIYLELDGRLTSVARGAAGVLLVIGAAIALVERRLRPILALHVGFSLLVPLAAWQTWATLLWYHAPERIWYAQYLSMPALAAIGLGGVVRYSSWLVRRWVPLLRWQIIAWPLALLACGVAVRDHYRDWVGRELFQRAHVNPNLSLTVVDRHMLPDFAWIHANIPPDAVLFNAPADRGLPLPLAGRRTVFWSGGTAIDVSTDWNYLFGLVRKGGEITAHAIREVEARDVRFIYAAVLDPRLRAGRSGLGAAVLRASPDLEMVYQSASASIFRIRVDGSRRLGLRDSDEIGFRGFDPIETTAGAEWRQTTGDARLIIRTPPTAATAESCYVRVLGPPLGSYDLRIGGRGIELTPQGFRVLRRDLGAESIGIAIHAAPGAIGASGRPDGLRVRNVTIGCLSGGGR